MRRRNGVGEKNEEKEKGTRLGEVGEEADVGRGRGRVVMLEGRRLEDEGLLADAADVDVAPVVDCFPVGAAHNVGDAIALGADADVVNPAEVVDVVGGEGRSRH